MDIVVPNEDINLLMKNYKKNKKKNKSNQSLTKYEKTRVLSERASQINSGSIVFVSNPERFTNSYQIAIEEFCQIGRLEIKFGRLEMIKYNLESGR